MAKKEKITYIDDGRTIADMSNVQRGFHIPERPKYQPRSSLKEQMKTFFDAMKFMFRPMLIVVGAIVLIYIIMYVLFSVM